MKSKWYLFASIFQLIVGVISIIAFIVINVSGEDMSKWIVTLILAIVFVVLGIIGIATYKKEE